MRHTLRGDWLAAAAAAVAAPALIAFNLSPSATFLNQVAAAGLYTLEDFRLVCDNLDLETKQERAHINAFKTVGEAKKGDVIQLDFTPEAGTRLVVNGQPRGNAIAGEEFYNALLRVWLGDKPADGDLKKGMLGG